MTDRNDKRHYTSPVIAEIGIIPGNVLCTSSFGFSINDGGFVDGDLDSPNNGYGFIDNGSY